MIILVLEAMQGSTIWLILTLPERLWLLIQKQDFSLFC